MGGKTPRRAIVAVFGALLLHIHAAEVAVAVAVVDLRNIGEELRLADPLEREGGLLARVGVRPLSGHLDSGVRSHLHGVVGIA